MEELEIYIKLTDNFYRDYKKITKSLIDEMESLFARFDAVNRKMTVPILTKFKIELWKLRHIVEIHKINLEVYKNQMELLRYYENLKEEHTDSDSEIELKKSLILKIYSSWNVSSNYILMWVDTIEKELLIKK